MRSRWVAVAAAALVGAAVAAGTVVAGHSLRGEVWAEDAVAVARVAALVVVLPGAALAGAVVLATPGPKRK